MRTKKVDITTRLKKEATAKHIDEAILEIRRLRREIAVLKSSNRLYRITRASDADCAASRECFSSLVSTDNKKKWIADRDLFIADDRVFVAVDTHTKIYFMDAITGSLYNFGECLTSNFGRTGFVRNKEKATEILMNFKGAKIEGGEDDAD